MRAVFAVAAFAAVSACALGSMFDEMVPATRIEVVNLSGTGDGGIAGVTAVYDNWAQALIDGAGSPSGYFLTTSTPRWHVGDVCSLTPGPGSGGNVLATGMVLTVGNLAANPATNADTQVFVYNTHTPNPGPPGTAVYSDLISSFTVGTGGTTINPGTVVFFTVNLTGLSGGGVQLPDDDFMIRIRYVIPGTSDPQLLVSPGFAKGADTNGDATFEGPNVGSSADFYYRDVDGNNILEDVNAAGQAERRSFGATQVNLANLVFGFTIEGGGCDPCDTNCDGSINGFDIQPFVDILAGAGGTPCSPCAADTNADGSINGFDIQGFVDCLGG